jgi:hypothetical protein
MVAALMDSFTIKLLVVAALTVSSSCLVPNHDILLFNLDVAGELCQPWMSWSQWFDLRYIFVQSMLQASVYVGLAVSQCSLRFDTIYRNSYQIVFAGSAAILVKSYAP